MSRSERSVLFVVGLTLFVLAVRISTLGQSPSADLALSRPGSANPGESSSLGRELANTQRADKLFSRREWAQARRAYDEVIAGQSDWYSPLVRKSVEHAILCSLKLQDGDDALRRTTLFHSRLKPLEKRESIEWPNKPAELAAWRADITHLEFVHRLFDEIEEKTRDASDAGRQSRLLAARMALDFQLLRRLDPGTVSSNSIRAMLSGPQSEWHWQKGNPFELDGKLLFASIPAKYQPTLAGNDKMRFLLSEIERLDPSTSKDDAARALLYRADLARRLYGPNTDPMWKQAKANLSLRSTLSYRSKGSGRNSKPFWEFEDDETRTMVGRRMKVITLPQSKSPLALWRSLEARYPNSTFVPEAIYQRGAYYQRRRQFSKAAAEYDRLITRFPKHARAKSAKELLDLIQHADVLLAETGVYPTGNKPQLWFACRNTEQVEFRAQRFDLEKYVLDQKEHIDWWFLAALIDDFFAYAEEDIRAKYLDQEVIKWSQTVPKSDQVNSHSTLAPLTAPGAYIVEARLNGAKQLSRGLVVVTSIAIVQKPLDNKLLVWVVDSRTGRPLVDHTVEIVNYGTTLTTDKNGLIEYTHKKEHDDYPFALVVAEDHSIACFELEYYGYSEPEPNSDEDIKREYCSVTDRPVYRPGSPVHFQIWARDVADRNIKLARSGLKLRLTIKAEAVTPVGSLYSVDGLSGGGFFSVASENIIKTIDLVTDQFGSVNGSFKLSDEVPLGEYHLAFKDGYAGSFRVEEYKQPEFEVTVTPAKNQARLGELVKAKVKARYYFGAPVSQAQVRYRILRKRYSFRYAIPRAFDWLYGNGYGNFKSSSILYDDWMEEEYWCSEYAASFESRSRGEVVAEGVVQLQDDGTAEISIDTTEAGRDFGEFDQLYILEVEVRDASRRTVEGEGRVLVTRQEFSAFVELNRGWYQTGGEVQVDVSTRTANNVPVSAEGNLTLHRITLDGKTSAESLQTADQTWNVQTGNDGQFRLKFSVPSAGRYGLVFQTQDSVNQTVTNAVSFWVFDPNMDGKRFQFRDLEIIPDRRSYKVGETARLLINTAQPNARLLLCNSLEQYRFIDVPDHSSVVEFRIEERHVPNHFVEAMLVRNGKLYARSCELFVPPVKDMLHVKLEPDKTTCKPGEKRRVRVSVSDADGNPISGELTLTAYDKSLTYIQDDYDTGPTSFISRRKTGDSTWGAYSTLGSSQFTTTGDFLFPEYNRDDHGWAQSVFGGGYGTAPSFYQTTLSLIIQQTQRSRGGPQADFQSLINLKSSPGGQSLDDLVQPDIRTEFADTAIWLPHLKLDQYGHAEAEVVFPDSLTTWRIRGYAVTKNTQVGDATAEVTTSKNLVVRLQSPRFFVERDEVVLSANVHNYLQSSKQVTAELIVPAKLFQFVGETDKSPVADKQGNLRLFAKALVKPGAEHRFDWPLKLRSDGLATITVKALTDEESDAMRLAFPVRSRGVLEKESQAGFFQMSEKSLTFELPKNIDPEKTRIELTLTPYAATAAFEAIPFLAGYPYGCVEQTMSRFYPTILAADTLKKMGTDLDTIATKIRQRHPRTSHRFRSSPLVDSAELQRMSAAGLQRLYRFQHDDGGWGWWQNDDSSSYMTAYVLLGLDTAANAGVDMPKDVYDGGVRFLLKPQKPASKKEATLAERHERALVAYVLSLDRSRSDPGSHATTGELIDSIYGQRDRLNKYGQTLISLALHNLERHAEATELLRAILKTVNVDEERATAYVPTSELEWWYWYNSDIETNAWILRALMAIDPTNTLAPQIVNWLVSKRQNGQYWRSTRDSAMAVHALAEFLLVMRQSNVDYKVAVRLDGRHVKDVRVSWQNLLEMENRVSLTGANIKPGRHRITLSKERGPLFYSMSLQYLAKPDRILASGNGLSIQRRYFKHTARSNTAAANQNNSASSSSYKRTQLKSGDSVAVGDIIEVELTINADETYEYMAFEDPKPAGCEPVQLRSGQTLGAGLYSNIELRDEKVVFFVSRLHKGQHILRYKLRAEIPGQFHALPTNGFAMYTPEIRARSDEMRLNIHD